MSGRTLKVVTNSNLFCKVSLIVAAILLVVIAIGGVVGTKYLREHERSKVLTEAQADVSTLTATILEELETPADVIRVLAGNPWVPAALVTGSEEDIERVNFLLDRYKKEFGVSVCYLMDITGTTIASSNRNTKTSFVGKNYSFRPYFKKAIDGKQGAYFALGVTSFKRGYYSSFPVRDGTGRIVGVAVIKKELDEAEEVFRNYKNSFFVSPEGVIFLSGDPAVLFRSLWFLSERTREQLLKSRQFGDGPFKTIFPEKISTGEEINFAKKRYMVAAREVIRGWKVVALRPAGSIFFFMLFGGLLTAFLVLLVFFFATYIKLTDLSLTRLLENDKKLSQIVAGNAVPAFVINKEHIITHWNNACEEITCLPASKMVGTKDSWVPFYAEKRPVMADLIVDNIPKEKMPSYYRNVYFKFSSLIEGACENEVYFSQLDKWLFGTAAPLRDIKGEIIGAIETLQDITERKQMENELKEAILKLKELDRLKSMFIASMSHELRTPLNSIIGFTGIILQGISGEITKEQRKQLTMVKTSAAHLLDLINDVIDVSKIEAGKVELTIEEFDLSALTQDVKKSFETTADEQGLKITLEAPEKLIVKSDERKAKQVIINFVSNAIKFTDKGRIEIKLAKRNESAEVSAADTGIGIKKEDIGKLFQAFGRIATENRLTEGSGLGLYLSKKIADLLGGDINAESEFGRGSVFTFTLPLKYKEPDREQAQR